jgi:hydrogenase maturation protease
MCLVIGYGNTLRGDDGVGQKIATIVAEWNLPGVRSHSVHQLTPELALDIAQSQLVIFVDAAVQSKLEVKQLFLDENQSQSLGHSSNPYTLLSLAKILYNHVPLAYWILVPGVNFAFSEEFSEVTYQAMLQALEEIKLLLKI